MLPPVSVASTTATQISYFDMAGTGQVLATAPTGDVNPCEGALFTFDWGAVGSPSTGTVYKLTECETYNGTYTDISGTTLTVAPVASSFSTIYLTNRGRKRFIKAVATTDSTQVVSISGIATPNNHAATTTAQIGAKCLETIVL